MSQMNPERQQRREPYDPPRVEVVGTLRELTLGATGTVTDIGMLQASI